MDELRWILLVLGILAIGGIWLWTARGSRQAPGNAELREPTVTPTPVHAPSAAPTDSAERLTDRSAERRDAAAERREWGISPLEPLSIRTADFSEVPALDEPMLTHADPVELSPEPSRTASARASFERTIEVDLTGVEAAIVEPEDEVPEPEDGVPEPVPPREEPTILEPPRHEPARAWRARVEPARADPAPPPTARSSPENSDRHATVPPPPNKSEKQKIVTVRVCAVGDTRWAGADLMNALEVLGLAYGRYQVYHRKHTDGHSIFCVASLVEPGTFDLSSMADEEFRGVSLFAILPGPLEPMQTVDSLLATARELARALSGTMQDASGMPFSPQRTEALLQDVARFQALLV